MVLSRSGELGEPRKEGEAWGFQFHPGSWVRGLGGVWGTTGLGVWYP